ncbi:MAG: hypothetical protein AAGC88_09195 [Bacteroidota bacterium]
MKKLRLLLLLTQFIFCGALNAQSTQEETPLIYLGQTPPDTVPQKFAPGILSLDDRYEFGITISEAGDEIYFGIDIGGKPEIHGTTLTDGRWSDPEPLLVGDEIGYNDPMLSPDENRLYFISTASLNGKAPAKDPDLWYMERTTDGWGDPINAGPVINSGKKDFYISFADNGTLYFGSNVNSEEDRPFDYDIYRAKLENGVYQKPERLPAPINTSWYELDVFIAPDESYMIFAASWKEGLGQGDLYISFAESDGAWSQPQNMGTPINDEGHQLCPILSKDGKYFFYTSNKDIYWVSAEIINRYRD